MILDCKKLTEYIWNSGQTWHWWQGNPSWAQRTQRSRNLSPVTSSAMAWGWWCSLPACLQGWALTLMWRRSRPGWVVQRSCPTLPSSTCRRVSGRRWKFAWSHPSSAVLIACKLVFVPGQNRKFSFIVQDVTCDIKDPAGPKIKGSFLCHVFPDQTRGTKDGFRLFFFSFRLGTCTLQAITIPHFSGIVYSSKANWPASKFITAHIPQEITCYVFWNRMLALVILKR